jgi:hypothetical protein
MEGSIDLLRKKVEFSESSEESSDSSEIDENLPLKFWARKKLVIPETTNNVQTHNEPIVEPKGKAEDIGKSKQKKSKKRDDPLAQPEIDDLIILSNLGEPFSIPPLVEQFLKTDPNWGYTMHPTLIKNLFQILVNYN